MSSCSFILVICVSRGGQKNAMKYSKNINKIIIIIIIIDTKGIEFFRRRAYFEFTFSCLYRAVPLRFTPFYNNLNPIAM